LKAVLPWSFLICQMQVKLKSKSLLLILSGLLFFPKVVLNTGENVPSILVPQTLKRIPSVRKENASVLLVCQVYSR
jgi:hypothetical protein